MTSAHGRSRGIGGFFSLFSGIHIQCARISVGFRTPRCRTSRGRPSRFSVTKSALPLAACLTTKRLNRSHIHIRVVQWSADYLWQNNYNCQNSIVCVANWKESDRVRYSVDPTGLDRAVGEYSSFKKELTCSSRTHISI